jgi:hypothetical protein
MPQRTYKCGACGASTKISDGDWNTQQRLTADAWQAKHIKEEHSGDGDKILFELDPSQLTDD